MMSSKVSRKDLVVWKSTSCLRGFPFAVSRTPPQSLTSLRGVKATTVLGRLSTLAPSSSKLLSDLWPFQQIRSYRIQPPKTPRRHNTGIYVGSRKPPSQAPTIHLAVEKQQEEQKAYFERYWQSQNIQPPSISRAIVFLAAFGLTAFGTAAYFSLRDTAHVADQVRTSQGPLSNLSSFFSRDSPAGNVHAGEVWGAGVTQQKLQVAKKHETAERLGHRMDWLMGWCDQLCLPATVKEHLGRAYVIAADNYLELPTSKQVLVPIIALNMVVFAGWLIAPTRGRLEHLLSRYFLHRPSSRREYTMLTSTFSHAGGLHFLFNNIALWSIGGSAFIYACHVGSSKNDIVEASSTRQFLAFFATAGVFAATVSHIVTAIRFRRLATLRGSDHAKLTLGRQSSLGASGAVYSALVMTALAFPHAEISLIFFPFFSVPIGPGVAGMVMLDFAGAFLKWRLFDHWAHLGGALFGYLYFYYGPEFYEKVKKAVLARMHIAVKSRSRI